MKSMISLLGLFSWVDLPVNLTESLARRSEDPRFPPPDGKRVVMKYEADLYVATLAYAGSKVTGLAPYSLQNLTNDGWTAEQSMPGLTPSDKYVVYAQGNAQNSVLYRKNMKSGPAQRLVVPPSGAKDYFPVVRDHSTYFFTRSTPPQAGQAAGYDQLMMLNTTVAGAAPVALPLNDCSSNNSDAAPVDEDYLIFSSGKFNPPYGLVVGEIGGGKVWRLDRSTVHGRKQHMKKSRSAQTAEFFGVES
jgi:Tol biopolymer transport system component